MRKIVNINCVYNVTKVAEDTFEYQYVCHYAEDGLIHMGFTGKHTGNYNSFLNHIRRDCERYFETGEEVHYVVNDFSLQVTLD